jgi:tetratricopeptide (TPR) repeat protein
VQPLDTLLAPELQEARKRRRNWLAGVGFLVFGIAVVALEFRSIHDWVQGIRVRRMATKAEAEILGGNIEEALKIARTAEQTKPDEPAAIRIRAKTLKILGYYGQPGAAEAAVQFWKKLAQVGAMRPADRLPYAEDLFLSGALAEAGNEIEALLKDSPSDGVLHRLAARWADAEGDGKKARDFAAKAVHIEPDNRESKLLLALLQLSSGTDALRDEAMRVMLELGKEHTREGIEALRRLALQPGISQETAGKVMVLLRQHPLANLEHRLLALSLDITIHPRESAAILDAAVQQYKKSDPGTKRAFGVWLNARGEYARALSVVPVDEAFKRKDLLLVCLDSLVGLRRWNEIERLLEMKDVPLDVSYKELFLARSAMEMGSATVTDLHWRRAHLAAGPFPDQMAYIANYAEKIGQFERAETAFRSLSANAEAARPAFEGLLRIAQKRGDMAMLYDNLKAMQARWPKDDSVKAIAFRSLSADAGTVRANLEALLRIAQKHGDMEFLCDTLKAMLASAPQDDLVRNDLAYFNLLRGKVVDESQAAAKELVGRLPASLPARTTLALAAIRKHDPAGALSVYQGLQVPWERFDPCHRAVYAAALGANGKTVEAKQEADALRWEELRPEERELIKQWRTQ